MKKNLFLICISILFTNSLFADSTAVFRHNNSYKKCDSVWFLKGFFQDEKKLITSPFSITKKKFSFWLPVIGATMYSFAKDEMIYSEFKKFQAKHNWVSKISPVITYGGDNKTVIATGALFYLGGMLLKNEKAKQTGILSIEAIGHAGLLVITGKFITGRQRPSYAEGKDYWHWFPASFKQFKNESQSKYDAFPSGHTIAAWSVATVIAKQYKNNKIIPVLAYAAATGVGISRVFEDCHWFSDVIIGAAMGYTIGSFVVKERKNTKWMLLPASNGKNIMLSSIYKL